MVIVDTTVWIDYFNGAKNPETEWLNLELDRQRLGITELVLCEVLQGVRDDAEAAKVEGELRKLEVFEAGTTALAVEAARHYRTLRSRGRTVRKTIDCLIATFCIREQHTLLHRDHDFDPFEKHLGLAVVHAEPMKADAASAD
jgi:predicted nucleic acid-binding protein